MKTSGIACACFILFLICQAVSQPQTLSQPVRPSRTGFLSIQLPELPAPPDKPAQFNYTFDPSRERFEIYIPADYSPGSSYGVLAWINPIDTSNIPTRFQPLLDEYKLLAVAAERCGNEQNFDRRVGLVMSAILQLSKSLNIDRSRLVISGFSGGGRISAIAAFLHPGFWRGSIGWAGSNYYKSYPLPMPVGANAPGINGLYPGLITDQNVKDARKNVKFVIVTGPKDMNLNDSRGIYRAMRQDSLEALLIEQPGMGHEIGSPESMRKALDFVLKN